MSTEAGQQKAPTQTGPHKKLYDDRLVQNWVNRVDSIPKGKVEERISAGLHVIADNMYGVIRQVREQAVANPAMTVDEALTLVNAYIENGVADIPQMAADLAPGH